jgi:RecB family endonuclease NucS
MAASANAAPSVKAAAPLLGVHLLCGELVVDVPKCELDLLQRQAHLVHLHLERLLLLK